MAFKEISAGLTMDLKDKKNKPFTGVYIGKKNIVTDIGEQVIWRFKNDAKVQGIYGFTNLNRVMEGICEGTLVRLTYLGTENLKTKFGMKDVHQVKVEIDEEAGIDTSELDEDL